MMELLIELYQEILERSDFICQIRLTQLSRCIHNNLKIYDFYNIDSTYLLSDDILKNYKYIKKLHTSNTSQILTDKGLKHLNLHTLNAEGYHSKITDEGIKHMKLY